MGSRFWVLGLGRGYIGILPQNGESNGKETENSVEHEMESWDHMGLIGFILNNYLYHVNGLYVVPIPNVL